MCLADGADFVLQTTVYRIVLMNGGVAEYEKILNTYTSTEDNQERKYAMYSLGASLDPQLKKRTLDWAVKSGDVKLQVPFSSDHTKAPPLSKPT